MASVFSPSGKKHPSCAETPPPHRRRTAPQSFARMRPSSFAGRRRHPAPFLRSAAQASAIRPPNAPPEASPKASEKNASTISGLAAFPVPTSSPSSPASPHHHATTPRHPDVTTSRHPDTPPSAIPAFSPLSPSIFPFRVRPRLRTASVSASVPFPSPHRSLTTPPSALPPPRRCATLPKCGIFPPLPLTPAAGTLKHTGTLRAGCKSPPAVNPLARGSPRARFQGKSADPVQVRGRR